MADKQKTQVRIMVFGTFDIIHLGHKHFFQQARKLAGKYTPFLIVSLARNKNVLRIKGKTPTASEAKRLAKVRSLSEVDKAMLGAIGDHMPHIIEQKPDIIALGYDQNAYVKGLRSSLTSAGLKTKIIRLKPYKPHLYKTSKILTKSY